MLYELGRIVAFRKSYWICVVYSYTETDCTFMPGATHDPEEDPTQVIGIFDNEQEAVEAMMAHNEYFDILAPDENGKYDVYLQEEVSGFPMLLGNIIKCP